MSRVKAPSSRTAPLKAVCFLVHNSDFRVCVHLSSPLGYLIAPLLSQYMEESQRSALREKLEAWQNAAGAGVTSCESLNSESAFGELQLARPLRAHGFLPTLQRRLAVLWELGQAVADDAK